MDVIVRYYLRRRCIYSISCPPSMEEYDEIIFQYKFNTNTGYSFGIWVNDNASSNYWPFKLPYGNYLGRAGSLHFSNVNFPSKYDNKNSVIKVEGICYNCSKASINELFDLSSSWSYLAAAPSDNSGISVNFLFDGQKTPELPWKKISISSFNDGVKILAENAQFRVYGGKRK